MHIPCGAAGSGFPPFPFPALPRLRALQGSGNIPWFLPCCHNPWKRCFEIWECLWFLPYCHNPWKRYLNLGMSLVPSLLPQPHGKGVWDLGMSLAPSLLSQFMEKVFLQPQTPCVAAQNHFAGFADLSGCISWVWGFSSPFQVFADCSEALAATRQLSFVSFCAMWAPGSREELSEPGASPRLLSKATAAPGSRVPIHQHRGQIPPCRGKGIVQRAAGLGDGSARV